MKSANILLLVTIILLERHFGGAFVMSPSAKRKRHIATQKWASTSSPSDNDDDDKEYARVRRRRRRGRTYPDEEEEEESGFDERDLHDSRSPPRHERRSSEATYNNEDEWIDYERLDGLLSDGDDYDDEDEEEYDLMGNVLIPNPLLDSMDPDGAAERFPELASDPRFWFDMVLFVAFLNFLSFAGPQDPYPDIPWF